MLKFTLFLILLSIPFTGDAQTQYADKSFYLVDSLEFTDMRPDDKILIDSTLIFEIIP